MSEAALSCPVPEGHCLDRGAFSCRSLLSYRSDAFFYLV